MSLFDASAGFGLEDVEIDSDGRVRVLNSETASWWAVAGAAKKKPKPKPKPPNTNCQGPSCNATAGCGPVNQTCNPTNTVPNCGCQPAKA